MKKYVDKIKINNNHGEIIPSVPIEYNFFMEVITAAIETHSIVYLDIFQQNSNWEHCFIPYYWEGFSVHTIEREEDEI